MPVAARTPGSVSKPHSDKVCQEPILKHILPVPPWSSQKHCHLLGTLTRWPGWHWPLTLMPSLWKPHGFKAVFMPWSHRGRNTDNISDVRKAKRTKTTCATKPSSIYSWAMGHVKYQGDHNVYTACSLFMGAQLPTWNCFQRGAINQIV